jgi:exopolyphosphatase/guanosine-5'-triphosphate,3'-diphosphate pyrophosphatase
MRLAAIDCGTNTVLLLVADFVPGRVPRLSKVRDVLEMPRLGQDLDRTGRLQEAAMTRTLAALVAQRERALELGAARILAIGTESLRAAANGAEFLARAEAAGVPLRVISGDEEARLSFRSVAASLPLPVGMRRSVLDIGGGSTELIVGTPHVEPGPGAQAPGLPGLDERPERFASVPIGSVRLTERLLRSDPPTAAEREALVAAIDKALDGLPQPAGELVALAGTATTVGALHLGLEAYDSARIDGMRVPIAGLAELVERLGGMSVAERRALPGLDARRADVIYAGTMILYRVALRADVSDVVISDRGVRWGALEEAADELTAS